MGVVLKVTPETLVKMASDIGTQIEDMKRQFESIETDINQTKSYWEGEASDAHKNQYDSLKKEIDQAVHQLENHPVNLLKMAGLYRETEQKLTETSQYLSENVII